MTNDEVIEEIYRSLPRLDCKGLCHDSCGPVVATLAEEDRMHAKGIRPPHPRFDLACSKLSADKRCTIYEDRPLVCRLYGMVTEHDVMSCPYGCVPERPLTVAEMDGLMQKLWDLTGDSQERIANALRWMAKNVGLDPLYRGMARWFLRRTADRLRARARAAQ